VQILTKEEEKRVRYGFFIEVKIILNLFWFSKTLKFDTHKPLEGKTYSKEL
jgi:hypothetical protein